MRIERFSQRLLEVMPQLTLGWMRHDRNYLTRGEIALPQLWVMEYLSHHDGAPMNEIADFLTISRPCATGLVDRLIAQGLARREPDSRDRRIVRVTITARGRQIVQTIWGQKRRTLTGVFRQIKAGERARCLAALEQVVGVLSRRRPRHGVS